MCNGIQTFFSCNHWEAAVTRPCEFAGKPECAIVVWDRVENRKGKCLSRCNGGQPFTQTIYIASNIAAPCVEMTQRPAKMVKEEHQFKVVPGARRERAIDKVEEWL